MKVKLIKTKNLGYMLLLEAVLSMFSFKKKKKPTTKRVEESITLNEFDINAAVDKLRANKALNKQSYDQQKKN